MPNSRDVMEALAKQLVERQIYETPSDKCDLYDMIGRFCDGLERSLVAKPDDTAK